MHDLIENIYEASIIGDKWVDLFEKFATRLGSLGGGIFAINGDAYCHKAGGACVDVMAEVTRIYGPVENKRGGTLLNSNYTGFVTELDLMTQEDLDSDIVYTEYLKPRGYIAALGTRISGLEYENLIFTLEGFPDFDIAKKSIAFMDNLRPHIARSLSLSARLALERAKNMTDAMKMIGIAAAVIDATGHIKASNDLFEPLMGKGFEDIHNKISLNNAQSDLLLQKTIKEIAISPSYSRSIPLRAKDNESAKIMHLVPLIGEVRDIFSSGNILIIINAAKANELPKTSQIQALFDLSPTESKIAQMIAMGKSSTEIATNSSRSVHTVRTQIKNILNKTGTSSQKELLAILKDLTHCV